jgi:glycosyltransferase involved in cell wall biosynthesis
LAAARPTVSIVIPAHNAAWSLVECLESLAWQSYPQYLREVLVVDNNSTDNTAKVTRAKGLTPLFCAKPGPSAARNVGIAKAKGEFIAFLDSDAVAQPDWLERLVEPFADETVGGVGGAIKAYRKQTGPEYHACACGMLDQRRQLEGQLPFMPPFAATANAAFRASVLREIGGFDEEFFVGEDADLSWRAQWAGHQLRYAEQAMVRHRHRAEIKPYLRQTFNYGHGSVCLFAKHRKRLGRRIWIEWKTVPALLSALALLPVMPFIAPNGWERVKPVYDLAIGLIWTAGRLAGSLEKRVLVI